MTDFLMDLCLNFPYCSTASSPQVLMNSSSSQSTSRAFLTSAGLPLLLPGTPHPTGAATAHSLAGKQLLVAQSSPGKEALKRTWEEEWEFIPAHGQSHIVCVLRMREAQRHRIFKGFWSPEVTLKAYTFCTIFAYNILQNIFFLTSMGRILPWGAKHPLIGILNKTKTSASSFLLESLNHCYLDTTVGNHKTALHRFAW